MEEWKNWKFNYNHLWISLPLSTSKR